MLNYSAIPVIVVICYIAITAIKNTKISNKWYPLISCALGAITAVAMFYIVPSFISAASLVAAIISGAISGLAATGSNQVIKQLLKSAENGELVVNVEAENKAKASEENKNVNKTSDTGGNP